ncbi:MAG: FG-GAP repeat protein [Alphaproteobacteria bacterium]|nr:FG-GAP repeat protein [Alphaproteobacteria bacterium]
MILLLAGLAGCTGDCTGPACEDAWPATRLVITDLDGIALDDNVLAQPDRVQGALDDGAEWSLAAHDGLLVLGMPEASAVAVAPPPSGSESLSALEPTRIQHPLAERFGASVAIADTDGDGRAELWVGAPGYEGDTGAVYRFPDLEKLDPDAWDLRLVGATPADGLGSLLVACGDVTGDGRVDLAVAAPWFAQPSAGWDGGSDVPGLAGAVWLLPSEALVAAGDVEHPWEIGPTWWGSERGAGVGRAMVCDRDLTGDGHPDLAIGAPFAGDADAGRVYVVTGTDASGPLVDVLPHTQVPDARAAGWFGAALATREDADGIELIVGAPGWDSGRGRAVAIRAPLSADARPAVLDAAFSGPRQEPDHFGMGLATGDLDGDGYSELFVGAPKWRQRRGTGEVRTLYDTGRAWIWGSSSRFRWAVELDVAQEIPAQAELRGGQPFLRVGAGAALLDVDGDGLGEVLQPVRAPDPGER